MADSKNDYFEYDNLNLDSVIDEKKLEQPTSVNIKVLDQNGGVLYFKIKKNMSLKKLMQVYCERNGLDMNILRFRYEGEAISEKDSPEQLNMEDGDAIEVFQQQFGGCNYSLVLIWWCLTTEFLKVASCQTGDTLYTKEFLAGNVFVVRENKILDAYHTYKAPRN